MTAVIYARYSSDSQREASIEGQLRDCKAYAEKNGITVVGTYIDRAYSAKTDDRPDFQRMIKDSGKKIFDVVLVWKLDRLMYIWTKETIKSNRFTVAYNSQIVVVVFDKLNNASVLVGIVKLDCNIAALMHIDTLYQVYDYPPVEGLNVFVL